jgi:lipid-binding SYLF domain-containing protein
MTARRFALLAALFLASQGPALAGPREEARLLEAVQVLEDTQAMPDQRLPTWLMRRAQGIAVMPTVVKVGLGLGGRGGKGVLTIRDAQGRWSNPVFITLAGGSIGWQAGVEASDIILVFTTRRSVEGLTGGKVTLGADASVAVGPVGRQVSGATDFQLDAEVYSYSRSKGLFGGIAIDGTVITIDHKANASYYERPGVLASDIFSERAPAAPASAQRLLNTLRRLPAGGDGVPATAATPAAPAPPPATAQQAPAPSDRGLESGGATTYPLDPNRPH